MERDSTLQLCGPAIEQIQPSFLENHSQVLKEQETFQTLYSSHTTRNRNFNTQLPEVSPSASFHITLKGVRVLRRVRGRKLLRRGSYRCLRRARLQTYVGNAEDVFNEAHDERCPDYIPANDERVP